ncbi:hypothetical protein, partial [Streptomyces sp. NPDC050263]|uniref:hypothetical protein n=1 Tax=Streptomyces sp. NPDC050263 TaxID=3155037 RepID=UPI00342796A1
MTSPGAERTRRTAVPVRIGEPAGSLKTALPTLQRTVGNKAVVGLVTAQRTTVQLQVQRAPGMPLEEAVLVVCVVSPSGVDFGVACRRARTQLLRVVRWRW